MNMCVCQQSSAKHRAKCLVSIKSLLSFSFLLSVKVQRPAVHVGSYELEDTINELEMLASTPAPQ